MLRFLFPISLSNLPIRLLLIGFLFVFLPVISYFNTAAMLNVSPTEFRTVMNSFIPSKAAVNSAYPVTQGNILFEFLFRYYRVLLNGLGFIVGLGLLGVKRWGYFLFLFFNAILIIDSISRLFTDSFSQRFVVNFVLTLFYFSILQFFLSKDISTPYLTLVPRSFRKKWRVAIPISGRIENSLNQTVPVTTVDISPTGCLAEVEGLLELNGTYNVVLNLDSEWEVKAKAVREEDGCYGLQFQYSGQLDPLKKRLASYLDSRLLPRFTKEVSVTFTYSNKTSEARIINISEGGFFMATGEVLKVGDTCDFCFVLFGKSFSGTAKVSWQNMEGNFEKPAGFGMSYQNISFSVLYRLFLFFIRSLYSSESRDR
jgi:Tfp pilus assembly protein PilZ